MLSQIDIQQIYFTKDTFDDTFRNICNEVFTPGRVVGNGYIIAILGFTDIVDK